jgi:hypothetical protein
VLPCGLCNTPSPFQVLVDTLFHDLLNEDVIVFINDILIYTDTVEEYVQLVRTILERLMIAGQCLAIKKSFFIVKEVEYLQD